MLGCGSGVTTEGTGAGATGAGGGTTGGAGVSKGGRFCCADAPGIPAKAIRKAGSAINLVGNIG
jgi:hypothetical protein